MKFKISVLFLVTIIFSGVIYASAPITSDTVRDDMKISCMGGGDIVETGTYQDYVWLDGENVEKFNCSEFEQYRFSDKSKAQEMKSSVLELSILSLLSALILSPFILTSFFIYKSGNRLMYLKKLGYGMVLSVLTSLSVLFFFDEGFSVDLTGRFTFIVVLVSNIGIIGYLFKREFKEEELEGDWKRAASIYISSLILGIIIGSWIYFNYFYTPILYFAN